jgi:signal transduction histidine kinase
MLDDFGLQAALEWHVRDFMDRYALAVDLNIDGDFDTLPDKHRTCAYRIVQEAMTNCVRHAQATAIHVTVTSDDEHLRVSISDNGIGLSPAHHRKGLGLRGIQERVKELRGTMSISRGPVDGTIIAAHLPLPNSEDVSFARVAG